MSKAGKNTHLEHLEDDIINNGVAGGEQAIKVLEYMGDLLSGVGTSNVAVTTKWDGAPAVICGTDPSDGQFFVGTKSVFSQDPKICKSEADIQALYSGALASKLTAAFRNLNGLVKGVLQGDLMFTDDKKTERIHGKSYITFRPNTITYAVEPKSELGKEIKSASLGIVFHTKYRGATLATMTASFDVTENDFTKKKGVWIQRAEFQDIGGVARLSTSERSAYDKAVNRARGSLKKCAKALKLIQSGKKTLEIDTELKKFFNFYVKEGKAIPSVDQAYNDFFYHLGREYEKAINKVKTVKSQEKKAGMFLEKIEVIENNEKEFKMLIAAYMNLQFCKHILVNKMKKVSALRLFVDKGGDYDVTTPEGFVAITSRGAIKLIDRLEFSRLNFTVPKNWG